MPSYVYIMTNIMRTVLYTGKTSNLGARLQAHRGRELAGFSARYRTTKLVYIEEHVLAVDAIARERQIKGWTRARKEALIESMNPTWRDLYESLEV